MIQGDVGLCEATPNQKPALHMHCSIFIFEIYDLYFYDTQCLMINNNAT